MLSHISYICAHGITTVLLRNLRMLYSYIGSYSLEEYDFFLDISILIQLFFRSYTVFFSAAALMLPVRVMKIPHYATNEELKNRMNFTHIGELLNSLFLSNI